MSKDKNDMTGYKIKQDGSVSKKLGRPPIIKGTMPDVITVKRPRGRPKQFNSKDEYPSKYKKVVRKSTKKIKKKTKLGGIFKVKRRGNNVPNDIWYDIFTKYKTGEYTIQALADLYGLNVSQVSLKLKSYGIEKDENAVQAIRAFDEGFQKISNIINGGVDLEEREQMTKEATEIITGEIVDDKKESRAVAKWDTRPPTIKQQVEAMKTEVVDNASSVKLANEIMDIVSKRNPQFARGFQNIGAIMIQKMKDILTGPDVGSGDLRNIAQAMKDIDSTMSIFPKQPTIAQQFNFGQKQKAEEVDTDINLNITVVDKDTKE